MLAAEGNVSYVRLSFSLIYRSRVEWSVSGACLGVPVLSHRPPRSGTAWPRGYSILTPAYWIGRWRLWQSSPCVSRLSPPARTASSLLHSITLSLDVPVDLVPSPVEGYAVLANNFVQDTWDMFPNGQGHAVIAPEPGTLSLFVLSLICVCHKRCHNGRTGHV